MTEQNPAIFLQSEAHPAEEVRRWIMATGNDQEGIFTSGELLVSEKSGTPDLSVDVAAGRCLILGDEDTYQGAYFCDNRGVTNLAIATADGSNPRIDLVVAKVQDSEYSGATDAWSLAVVTGAAAGSPSVPATPDSAIPLAQVAVAAAAGSIVDANITDVRVLMENVSTLDARLTTAESDITTAEGNITTNASDITTAEGAIDQLEADTAAISRSGTTTTITDTTLVDVNAATVTLDGTTVNLDGSTLVNAFGATIELDASTKIDLQADQIDAGSGAAGSVEFDIHSPTTAFRMGYGGTTNALGYNSSNEAFMNPRSTVSGSAELRTGTGGGSYSVVIDVTSSRRYKDRIEPIPVDDALENVLGLRPVTFHSTIETDDPDRVNHGFIAEEVYDVEPAFGEKDMRPGMEGEIKGLNETSILAHAIAAIQVLEARIAELEGNAKKAK